MRRPHSIEQQFFLVDYESESNGLLFRKEFTDFVKKELLSVVENVFDEICPGDKVIRIERLEIDLGEISYPINAFQTKDLFKRKLKEELKFRITSIVRKEINSGKDIILSKSKSEEELLLFFLKNGYLPWWCSESNRYTFSIKEFIDRIISNKPSLLINTLKKGLSNNETDRLLFHISPQIIPDSIASCYNVSSSDIVAFEKYLNELGLKTYLSELEMVYRKFLIYYFIDQKKTNVSERVFEFLWVDYLEQNNLLPGYLLHDFFPEKYFMSWLAKNGFYGQELLRAVDSVVGQNYSFKRYDLFKKIVTYYSNLHGTSIDSSGWIVELYSKYNKKDVDCLMSIFKSGQNLSIVHNKDEIYFSTIEAKLRDFFYSGFLSFKDRIIGVESITILLYEWHKSYPNRLKTFFSSIPSSLYLQVFHRISYSFDKALSEVIFKHYFNADAAKVQIYFSDYKKNVIAIFFEKGTIPWADLISGNVQYVEIIISKYYDDNPADFIRLVKKSVNNAYIDFIEKVEMVFSNTFVAFIKTIADTYTVPDSSEKKIILPQDQDLLVYYLYYFEKYRKLPDEVAFSIEELVSYFLEKFPTASNYYFVAAQYLGHYILSYNFSPALGHKIKSIIAGTAYEPKEYAIIRKDQKHDFKTTVVDPVYLTNAGLVLLHPFLQRFFSKCKLLEKRSFINKEAQIKAIYLLHYLARKNNEVEEHMLLLNKILCGVTIYEPIPRMLLSQDEKDLCEDLLQGVIENWTILKKTSIDNFRVSFLQREGKLISNETGWQLSVDERGYDILLDKLPWSISMFKLPWMTQVFYTKWR